MIYIIEIDPCDPNVISDLGTWLTEKLGPSAWVDMPRSRDEVQTYDALVLESSKNHWEAYVDPQSFKAFVRIKDNLETAMLFKLTFGGRS